MPGTISRVSVATVLVLDQGEALDFYVNKLGFEVARDLKQGPFRWLTVRVPGDSSVEVNLLQPGPPVHDESTAAQLRELISKGAMSSLVVESDDVKALYETLQARGVTDFTQEPIDHAYGTDMGIRDPFGNGIRVLQPKRASQRATA
ncbi:MAG TPA: VOC family protein [Candidatus Limnocylindria bacterium]